MTGGLFFVRYCILPPSYATTLLEPSTLPPSYPAHLLTLLSFWCCHFSGAVTLLTLPPSYSATLLTCHLLPLPSLLCCTPLTLQLFWCPLIISTAELPFFVVSVHLTSLPLPAHQDHPINRITDKPGMWTKTDHRQTLWGGKFIFYEIHRRRQPCSESILRGVGLFCETILFHRRQQPHPEVSPRHIDGFSELHDGRTFFVSEGNESHFP